MSRTSAARGAAERARDPHRRSGRPGARSDWRAREQSRRLNRLRAPWDRSSFGKYFGGVRGRQPADGGSAPWTNGLRRLWRRATRGRCPLFAGPRIHPPDTFAKMMAGRDQVVPRPLAAKSARSVARVCGGGRRSYCPGPDRYHNRRRSPGPPRRRLRKRSARPRRGPRHSASRPARNRPGPGRSCDIHGPRPAMPRCAEN